MIKAEEIEKAKSMVGKIFLRDGTDMIPPSAVFVERFVDASNFERGYYLSCKELNTDAVYWLSLENLKPFDYVRYVNEREEWQFRHALARADRLRMKMEMKREQIS